MKVKLKLKILAFIPSCFCVYQSVTMFLWKQAQWNWEDCQTKPGQNLTTYSRIREGQPSQISVYPALNPSLNLLMQWLPSQPQVPSQHQEQLPQHFNKFLSWCDMSPKPLPPFSFLSMANPLHWLFACQEDRVEVSWQGSNIELHHQQWGCPGEDQREVDEQP